MAKGRIAQLAIMAMFALVFYRSTITTGFSRAKYLHNTGESVGGVAESVRSGQQGAKIGRTRKHFSLPRGCLQHRSEPK